MKTKILVLRFEPSNIVYIMTHETKNIPLT